MHLDEKKSSKNINKFSQGFLHHDFLYFILYKFFSTVLILISKILLLYWCQNYYFLEKQLNRKLLGVDWIMKNFAFRILNTLFSP